MTGSTDAEQDNSNQRIGNTTPILSSVKYYPTPNQEVLTILNVLSEQFASNKNETVGTITYEFPTNATFLPSGLYHYLNPMCTVILASYFVNNNSHADDITTLVSSHGETVYLSMRSVNIESDYKYDKCILSLPDMLPTTSNSDGIINRINCSGATSPKFYQDNEVDSVVFSELPI